MGLAMVIAVALAAGPRAVAPQTQPDIVVNGYRVGPPTVRAEIRSISAPVGGQLPRFETPVCPRIVGLPDAAAHVVDERIRAIAQRAAVRTDKTGCRPNLTLFVAADGAGFVRALRANRPRLFDSLSAVDYDRLVALRGPAWTWRETSVRRADGGPVERVDFVDFGAGGPPYPTSIGAYIVRNAAKTRIGTTVRQDTDLAFIVLSAEAIEGLTLEQVAGYVAMTGMIPIRPEAAMRLGEPSVLTIFADRAAGRTPQTSASAFDIAYLRGTYAGQPGFSADQKTTEIAQFMAHAP